MATLQLMPSTLTVHFTRAEKLAGLIRDVEVPLSAVRGAELVADPLHEVRGLRAPGLALPGVRKIGTWRRPGATTLVCVRRDQPAVWVTLEGQRHHTLLIGADDAAEVVARLRRTR